MAEGRTIGGIAALAVVVAAATAAALALSPGTDDAGALPATRDDGTLHNHDPAQVIGTPERHTGPQGQVGQFVAKCTYSHSAPDDPIVHYQHPGRSHRHDFYGAVDTNAFSTAEQLLGSATTCDKPADTAAYWQPTLYDGDEVVEPLHLNAYYRAAPGVDPAVVEAFPLGLELIAGDASASTPQRGEAAGWVCGSSTRFSISPPNCPDTAPLHMLLTFPDCWDGEHLRSDDFHSHAAYSAEGECPPSHPVHVPQLTVSVKYPISGSEHDLRLASGNTYSTHGDFLNSWEPEGLQEAIDICIGRDVVCDLASNREEDGPFFAG